VLSRELAHQNHFPAVDVLSSISRLMNQITDKEHRDAAGKIRDLMATFKRSEDLINIGAYAQGSNQKLDQAVALKDEIDKLLRQDMDENAPMETTREWMLKIAARIR
jgi:flagellum-specific ATP synthase